MKRIILQLLQCAAKATLQRRKPIVVAVTGSVGKTSTREAIALALEGTFTVRTPKKNYNNEFGLPFAVLGETSPGKNPFRWIGLFWRARTRGGARYPRLLVLEYGADRAGDIRALCALATPNVSVITAVSPVHVANYRDMDALIAEKASLGVLTDPHGLVLLNADYPSVLAMADKMTAPVCTYAAGTDADVCAHDVQILPQHRTAFTADAAAVVTTARVTVQGDTVDLTLRDCLGAPQVAAATAAIAVARHFGIPPSLAAQRLSARMRPVAGRLRPLAGIRGALIIDDTYNAAPASVHAALDVLARFTPGHPHGRRIVALGTMAELGDFSAQEHADVGRHMLHVADLFLAVGEEMCVAHHAALAAGMPRDRVEWFSTPEAASAYLDRAVQAGDIVLVKGSQSARMEKVVKGIMAEPLRAAECLVRQEVYWEKR